METQFIYGEETGNMDLYFAGMSHVLAAKKITELGCNRLFSQEINRSEIKKIVEQKKAGTYTGKILIDSGAFTAHTKGVQIDVDEYIEYLNGITDYVDWYAQVDHIPGQFGKPKTPQQLAKAPKLSWENYLYMRPRMKEPNKLMPIYHQGEKIEWLHNMLEWTDENSDHIEYIGISPANDKSQPEKNKFIEMCFSVIRESSNPNVKTHAYGMTNLKVLESYPFTSADSTSWALTAVNGSIMSKYGVVSVSQQNQNSSALRGKPEKIQQQLREYVASYGYDLDDLTEAPEETVIKRIVERTTLTPLEVYDVLHCRDKIKPARRGLPLVNRKPKVGTTGKNYSNITKEQAEIIKYENGRSIAGRHDHKAYLHRIWWNIDYLKRWADSYEYKPICRSNKASLLYGDRG